MARRLLFLAIFVFAASSIPSLAEELSDEQAKFFESKIRPVLVKECFSCHSNQTGNAKGGLRLDTVELTRIGGNSGPAIVPNDLDESLLYNAINHLDFVMPPKRKLPESVIRDFREWIEMGAPDPRVTEPTVLEVQITPEDIERAKQEFWAYKPPVAGKAPQVKNRSWSKSEIDRYVLGGLEQASMTPPKDAPAYQILRRLSFDLVGLPPSLDQIESFERAYTKDPDHAVAEMVDTFLDQPQFGERWGRHWLDIARYAESNGRDVNMTFPHAWRYRDYVYDSFNEDKPYDRFLQEQIAGDLLPAKTDEQWATNLIATGFLVLGPKNLAEQRGTQFTADLVDEQIDTTTRAILGTSVACARCHDHKFDPIPQTDYYALAGIFVNTVSYFGTPASKYGSIGGVQNRNSGNLLRLPIDDPSDFEQRLSPEKVAELKSELDSVVQEIAESRRSRRMNDAANPQSINNIIRLTVKAEMLSAIVGSIDEEGNPISYCMGVQPVDRMQTVRVLERGEIDRPGQVVPRGFPAVLQSNPTVVPNDSSGRLEFAKWISSRENPLTARVMVNRIWQHLMGTGIVRSTENFGTTGLAPTHPELLDYLAVEFMNSDWSIKSMVRKIANSHCYRMGTEFRQDCFEQDPDNRLLWRMTPKRLDAESIRDAMLFVSNQLELDRPRASEVAKAGFMRVRDGNLVNPAAFVGISAGMSRSPGRFQSMMRDAYTVRQSGGERLDMINAKYRSVYLPIVRGESPRVLEVFDFAEPSMVVGERESSNTPNQSLFMLNNPFVIAQSEALARLVYQSSEDRSEQIQTLFRLVYSRDPRPSELAAIRSFIDTFEVDGDQRTRAVRTYVAICQSLFASADFRYVN